MHPHPSSAYLRLSEGPDDLLANELSLTRRLIVFCVALVLFSGTSLFATAAFDLDKALIGKAIAATGKASDDDDNSGPGGGDDDDDDTDTNNRGTGGDASESDDNGDGDHRLEHASGCPAREGRRLELGPERQRQHRLEPRPAGDGLELGRERQRCLRLERTGAQAQATDSGTDDNHNGATDSHEPGQQRARQ